MVEIGRPDHPDAAVHGHDLGVEHRRAVVPDLDALLQQLRVAFLAGQLHEPLVGLGAREQDLDVDASASSGDESVREVVVGHEVGGRDPDLLGRHVDEGSDGDRDRVPARFGGAGDHLHVDDANGFQLGELVDLGVEHRRFGLDPVVEERRAEPVHRRTGHPDMGVAPTAVRVPVAHPFVRDPHPAGERDDLVAHHHLAVGPVIRSQRMPRVGRTEEPDRRAGVTHPFDETLVDGLRTQRIEQHPDAHTTLRSARDRVGELGADVA